PEIGIMKIYQELQLLSPSATRHIGDCHQVMISVRGVDPHPDANVRRAMIFQDSQGRLAMLPEAMMPEPAVLVMLCEVAVVAAAKVFRLGETGHVRASNRYTHSAWNESYIVEVGPLPTGGIGVQADGAVAAFRIIGHCHFEPLIGPCHGN